MQCVVNVGLPPEEAFPLTDMPEFSAGVLVLKGELIGVQPGDPVIRIKREFVFPSKRKVTFADMGSCGATVRPLRDNESLIITKGESKS